MPDQSVLEYVQEWFSRRYDTSKKYVQQDKQEAKERGVDTIDCDKIKYRDIFFDMDDTLTTGWRTVDRVDALETLNNLKRTREVCGIPRLHIASFNSKEGVKSTLKSNGMSEYFTTIHATGSDKSNAISTQMGIHGTKPKQALMVGHDLEFDFNPIKANPETRDVNIRLVKDRISILDSPITQDERKLLKGFCYVDSIGWQDMKPAIDGSDGCMEDTEETIRSADNVCFANIFGDRFKVIPKEDATKWEEYEKDYKGKRKENYWDEYDKEWNEELKNWR